MLNNGIRKRTKKIEKTAGLVLILSLASFLTFYPHLSYPYPLHGDEWFHINVAKNIAKLGGFPEKDVDTGRFDFYSTEKSYQLLLAGLDYLLQLSITQWIYLPTVLHILAILSVFHFTRRFFGEKEAYISALLTALTPSNVTIGGPVFLIPVNLSLIFIPLGLLFAFDLTNLKPPYNSPPLLAVTTFLLYAHPPTALALLTILGFYLLLNLLSKEKKSREKAKLLFLTVLLSVLISIPNYLPTVQRRGLESIRFDFLAFVREIPYLFGFIPTTFFILSSYFLCKTKSKETWSLLLASTFLVFNIFLPARFGLNWLIPYNRTYIPLFLLMSIIASYGFSKLLQIKPIKNLGIILLLITLALTTYLALDRNLKTPYYHIIDEKDYQNFLWIKENTKEDAIVLLDPWKARAFPAIAERKVYSVMPFGSSEKYSELINNTHRFFSGNCTDTSFLIENNISVIYSPEECKNPDLVKVKDNIYFLNRSLTTKDDAKVNP